NPVNEILKQRMQNRFGQGYNYAYLYPGMQKVVQAAGRVIRTPEDRGTLYLIDDRFTRAQVRSLLPAWWQIQGQGIETTNLAATAAGKAQADAPTPLAGMQTGNANSEFHTNPKDSTSTLSKPPT
ncbi:MAG: hypothetical protein RL748_4232, partial [Pseudomonadota bacterium]